MKQKNTDSLAEKMVQIRTRTVLKYGFRLRQSSETDAI